MEKILVKGYGFDKENVITLYNKDATFAKLRSVFKNDLSNRAKIHENDRVLVYYAGHGTLRKGTDYYNNETKEGFIIPYDATIGDYGSYFEMETLVKCCQDCPAKHVFLVLDCCYSGYAVNRDIRTTSQATEPDYYLEAITRRRAIEVLAAGEEDEPVGDSGIRRGNSPFTGALLEILESQPYGENRGILTAEELGAKIKQEVPRHYRGAQNPVFNHLVGSRQGDFVFGVYKREDGPAPQQFGASTSVTSTSSKGIRQQDNPVKGFDLAQLLDWARDCFARSSYYDAIVFFDKILELDPGHIEALNYKGIALTKLDKHDEARACFTRVLEIDPKNIIALTQLSLIPVRTKMDKPTPDSANMAVNRKLKVTSTSRDYTISFETTKSGADVKLSLSVIPKLRIKPKGGWELEEVQWDNGSYTLLGAGVSAGQNIPVLLKMFISKAGQVAWWLDVQVVNRSNAHYAFNRQTQIYNTEKINLVKYLDENFPE